VNKSSVSLCVLVAALGAAGFASGVRAEAAAAAPAGDDLRGGTHLEEVVVTAQKRAENLQVVPVAETAFTAAALDRQQTKTIADLTSRVPNFSVTAEEDGPNVASIYIRGIGIQDLEKSFDPPIGVVFDGVYLGTNTGQLLQSFDFDSLEVLRGPQGTLFGKNTTGGAVVVNRSLPGGEEINGKVSVTVGNFGENDYKGVLNIPIIKDKFWLKIAGFSENNDGFITNLANRNEQGQRKFASGTITALIKPVDHLDVVLTYDQINDMSRPSPYISDFSGTKVYLPLYSSAGQLYQGPDVPCAVFNICGAGAGSLTQNVANSGGYQIAHYFLKAGTANLTYHLDNFDLVSVTGYRSSREQSVISFGAIPDDYFEANRPQTYNQFTEELRIASRLPGPFNFVAGGFFFDSNYAAQQDSTFDFAYFGVPVPPGVAISYVGNATAQNSKSAALFAQGNYKITSRLKLTVGGRYTYDDKHFSLVTLSEKGSNFEGSAVSGPYIRGAKTWGNFTPHASLDYAITDDSLAYVSYSRGYNAGGFNGRGTNASNIGPYNPETVDSYEAGFKTDLLDRRVRFNAAAFHSVYSNKQQAIIINDPILGTATVVQNVAGETIDGLELESTVIPFKNFALNASVGYLDARYTNFTAALLSGFPATDNTKLNPVRSPHYTGNLEADYTLPIGANDLLLTASYNYTDTYDIDPTNDPRGKVPATSKVDASIGYEFDAWHSRVRLTAFGKNLGNVIRANTFLDAAGGAIAFVGTNPGRIYGLELMAKF
jgi:iron complex outermembrane receptor protein